MGADFQPEDSLNKMEDGRNRRRSANRARIVEAFLHLIRAGSLSPSSQEVAEQANVSPRTVFRCFQDMETLYREISIAVQNEFLPRATLDLDTTDRRERLQRLLVNRANMFEDMKPFRLAAEVLRHLSPALNEDHAFLVMMEKERLATVINPDGAMDETVFQSLCAVTSFEFWKRLRIDQNLDCEMAAQVMMNSANAIFDTDLKAGPVGVA